MPSNKRFAMSARSILILSLGLNLVLGAWVLATFCRAPVDVAALPATEAPAAKSLPVWRLKRTNIIEVATNRVDAPGFRWSLVETNDFEAYVANLRGIGCPDYTVRHLLIGEIEELYSKREEALERPGAFWETPGQRRALETRIHHEQAALEEEKRALLLRLVGVQWSGKAEREWVTEDTAPLVLGFLADEKALRLMDAMMRLEKLSQAFQDETDRIVIDTDEPRLEGILVGAKRELESGLTPGEVEEAILRGVNLVKSFMERDGLIGIPLTGDELRRMTAIASRGKNFITMGLRVELDGHRHGEDQEMEKIIKQVSPEAEREIQALLGPQRTANYERSKDAAFREFAGTARRLELPLELAVKAYDIRRAAEAAAQELKANAQMTPEQRRVALDAMRRETEQAIAVAVGAPAAKEFFRDDRGWTRTAFGPKEARR